MADVQTVQSWMQRNHFLLRRLHSLFGIVPIGAFLIEHLLTNSLAWLGPEKFNAQVHWLHELHYLLVLEIVFIFAPIAFHALYGVVIALQARNNVREYPYLDNWRFTLQRLTGWITLIFILLHLGHYRFAHWFGGTPYVGSEDPFAITAAGFGWGLPPALWYPVYVVGLTSAVFHFTNGLCTFLITWGVTVGDKARQRVSVAAAGLALVLLVWGLMSLAAFRFHGSAAREALPPAHGATPVVLGLTDSQGNGY